jgi:hypothetical protein
MRVGRCGRAMASSTDSKADVRPPPNLSPEPHLAKYGLLARMACWRYANLRRTYFSNDGQPSKLYHLAAPLHEAKLGIGDQTFQRNLRLLPWEVGPMHSALMSSTHGICSNKLPANSTAMIGRKNSTQYLSGGHYTDGANQRMGSSDDLLGRAIVFHVALQTAGAVSQRARAMGCVRRAVGVLSAESSRLGAAAQSASFSPWFGFLPVTFLGDLRTQAASHVWAEKPKDK